MKTFASNLAAHRCGHCDRLQSVFAVGLTFKGGLRASRTQEFLSCSNCGAHLRLTHRHSRNSVLWAQIGVPVLIVAIGALMLWLFLSGVDSFGALFMRIMLWWVAVTLMGMTVSGLASRYFYKLDVIG